MAPLKRGADSESSEAKKLKHSSDNRASKRQRKVESTADESKAKPSSDVRNLPKTTILKSEETSFPRGGASVLTPLEHKQIQIEATQDVLFEQSGKKRTTKGQDGDDEDDGEPKTEVRKGKKHKKSKADKKANAQLPEEPQLKIEGLSYKKLVIGSMVLGQVTQITSRDVVLALPNNLSGFIPLTAISDKFTSRIEQLLENDEEDEDVAGTDKEDGIDLQALFHVGQYLRAYVTATEREQNKRGIARSKKRIELSTNPTLVNRGISKSDIVKNSMIQASVLSNEEHGLVMDMGFEDQTVKGFMSSKELGSKIDHSLVQEGAVFLCLVTGLTSDSRIIKLSADHEKAANPKKFAFLGQAPSIDLFLPGTAVEMLITDTSSGGVTGKLIGLLDATADLFQSGAAVSKDNISDKYKIGSKYRARVICTFPDSEPRKVGVSLLDHVIALASRTELKDLKDPLDALQISSIVEEARVTKVEPTTGLFLDLGVKGLRGFAHISRISNEKIESLAESSGPYKLESKHRARVIGYNPMDGLYVVSLEKSVLDQPFFRHEDVQVGQVVKGKVEKLIATGAGRSAVIVNLAEGITGVVPEMHLADVHLQHPDRKFREGVSVTARVLAVDLSRRKIRLTLKKSLVNSETRPWTDYDKITVGMKSPGTLTRVISSGAVVQFYGQIKAWLPISEMSEAYIDDPTIHFRVGQVVDVRVLLNDLNGEDHKLVVSCKDPETAGLERQTAMNNFSPGDLVTGNVKEKSADSVTVDLGDGIRGIIRLAQLSDGSEKRNKSTLERVEVGRPLRDLVVLMKNDKKPIVGLTNKPSLVKDAKAKKLITRFEDVIKGQKAHGFVRSIEAGRIFVEFAGGIVGLLLKSQLTSEMAQLPEFGLRQYQSITARILDIDESNRRFLLTMKSKDDLAEAVPPKPVKEELKIVEAVDSSIKAVTDLQFGKTISVRVKSVKSTQVNVQVSENIHGRIYCTEAFDTWDEIQNKQHPLRQFHANEILQVRIIGFHDAKNHRFLPISHRQGRNPVYELSAKKIPKLASVDEIPTLKDVTVGSTWTAFVNHIGESYLWVNLAPVVRGRIDFLDLSDDVSLLADVEKNFPIGTALQVSVKAVDVAANRLDLTAGSSQNKLTYKDLKKGMVVGGLVLKVTESSVIVQINDHIAGRIFLTELVDDYSQANPTVHTRGDIIRVCIVNVDVPNKKVVLSTRPSNVLSSSLPVKDPQITEFSQLEVNQVIRGFVKSVADSGLFVFLGLNIIGYATVSDLSDAYIKDWKSSFEVDQLVTGRITSIDTKKKQISLSLKASVLVDDYVPPVEFNDLKKGDIVTGKVRKVQDFGVFIVVDNSNNVSGLCHRSEIADEKVEDLKALYKEGDVVKAKILKVDPKLRRINFGLKYSYFKSSSEDAEESDSDGDVGGVELMEGVSDADSEGQALEDDADVRDVHDVSDEEANAADEMDIDEKLSEKAVSGLSTSGFDWNGTDLGFDNGAAGSDSDSDNGAAKKKKRHRKPEIKVDRTGDLDKNGPQSVADFERLLLGQPNSAELWVRYMVFQRELNEVEKARQIARRALSSIFPREETAKLDVWTALLHLENDFSSDDAIDEVFKEACQYNNAREMHDRLIKIYILSGKLDKADSLYQTMLKNKTFTRDPALWLSYATFLMTTLVPSSPTRARALLQRATQSVPANLHRHLTTKFAALEYKSPNGDAERGRTIFEGLVAAQPRKWDTWDVYVELERAHGEKENVRGLFERMVKGRVKKRRAAVVFRRWVEFEELEGSAKGVERVRAVEREWMEKREEEGVE
ncbi:nucleic acid-binding protein [Mytilinidion resinicola]|uniref:rRNA biogenesis protein RRP5 n=1 Tax=Mytilinidion resinicola TaxID=574789 RepID=A0A6A6YLY7_9PEZI|nr:nucleic acid-binding protein [Mytilinidion resinicola]KAF2808994.1 nucleic acid-binding protein [Mytilinidion resinicola]